MPEGTPQVEVVKVSDGPPAKYRVLIAGIDLEAAAGNPDDLLGATANLYAPSAYTRAIAAKLATLIPEGAEVMLVGHSNGGTAAMWLASDPTFTAHHTVTHVLAVGAPISGVPNPSPPTQVFEINNVNDAVPRADGANSVETPNHHVHNFDGTGEEDPHSVAQNYMGEVSRLSHSDNADARAFFDSADGYYEPGASGQTVQQVRVTTGDA